MSKEGGGGDVQQSRDDANLIAMSMSILFKLRRQYCCSSQPHIGNPAGHTVGVLETN